MTSAERAHEVVLKVLHRGRGSLSRDSAFGRFIEEFMLLYDVEDPSVAEIYDFRVTGQYCYIAMEYFRAGHLQKHLSDPVPDLPADLGHLQPLLERLLAKPAEQRPASARELIEAPESARVRQSTIELDFSATSA